MRHFLCVILILFVTSSLNSSSVRNVVFVKRCYCSYHYSIAVFTYSRKYLCRRIPHASNGSFNPYVITNKHAHIINGNIFSTDKKDMENKCVRISTEAYAASSTTPQFTTVPRHFINYCFKHPGKFSCVLFVARATIKLQNALVSVLYVTPRNLSRHNKFECSVSEAILPNSTTLYCDLCQTHSGRHFIAAAFCYYANVFYY